MKSTLNFNEKRIAQLNAIIDKSVVASRKTAIGNMYIATTGVHFSMIGESPPCFVGGFSCKKSQEEAELVARYECRERAFAMFDFRTNQEEDFPLISLSTCGTLTTAKAEQVLLRHGADAVGLAAHSSQEKAISHAANELIERALLGQIFYCKLPIVNILNENIDGHQCKFFTTADEPRSGFVMAILIGKDQRFLTLGASRDDSMPSAINKSRAEAIMLADNILCKKTLDHLTSDSTRQRMTTQTDIGMILERINFLQNASVGTIPMPSTTLQQKDMLRLCGEGGIAYSILAEAENFSVVRSISDEFLTISKMRKIFAGSEMSHIDFVC